jgi:UDP-glucose 4-epimerase
MPVDGSDKPAGSARKRARQSNKAAAGSDAVIAVTGAFGSLGRRLVRVLEADPTVERIVGIDIKSPLALEGGSTDGTAGFLARHPKLSAHQLDLSEPGADRELGRILERERAGRLVHLALLSTPTHALEMAHETETIGTLHTLHAAANARVSQVVSLSSAMCYGARPDNPAWITEDQPLRPPQSRSLRDKADADQQVRRFATEHPAIDVAVARVGAVIGTASDHFFSRMLSRRVVPAVLGFDPLWQLLWVDDAIDGLAAMLRSRARGPFNLVGRGVLPLSHVLTRLARLPVYLPAEFGRALVGALWSAQLVEMPKHFLDFFRWSWVCDGTALERATGFVPKNDIAAALTIFSQGGARGRPDETHTGQARTTGTA